jgi:protein ATS1
MKCHRLVHSGRRDENHRLIACLGHGHSPTVMSRGQDPIVFALGSNGSGQLGIGHTKDVNTPQKCIFRRYASGSGQVLNPTLVKHDHAEDENSEKETNLHPDVGNVTKIVAGGNHTLALTGTGALFVAGKHGLRIREDGNKARDSGMIFLEISHVLKSPSPGSESSKITDVAATWEASFVVLDHKFVLSWGTGLKGELGLGASLTEVNDAPRMVLGIDDLDCGKNVTISSIQAGMAHVVVLLSNGSLYGWGAARKGQLGNDHIAQKVVWLPSQLYADSEAESCSFFKPGKLVLGKDYTCLLAVGQAFRFWGGKQHIFSAGGGSPRTLEERDEVVSGWSSVHCLSRSAQDGAIISMGMNNHGQHAPAGLPPISVLKAGSEHCVAITTDDQVLSWGWGEHGNCGEPIDSRGNVAGHWNVIAVPHSEELAIARDVAAGCATTFVICGPHID